MKNVHVSQCIDILKITCSHVYKKIAHKMFMYLPAKGKALKNITKRSRNKKSKKRVKNLKKGGKDEKKNN